MTVENFNVGAIIEYNCDEGHLLVGPTTRICLPTGFYNEFPPVCKSKFHLQNSDQALEDQLITHLFDISQEFNVDTRRKFQTVITDWLTAL